MKSAAQAELALHLEVSATPTPGNVDRERDAAGLSFAQFQAGATGARAGLAAIANGTAIGDGFEAAVSGAVGAAGENTHFGALLLLSPLVAATSQDRLSSEALQQITHGTTVDDAVAFYRALDHASVAVPDPPADFDELDARRGSDAIPAVRDRNLTLADLMAESAPRDLNADEWVRGFPRTMRIATAIQARTGSIESRAADAHLEQLAADPDTLVWTQHGEEVARTVQERASTLHEQGGPPERVRAFAEDLVDRDINPGTTADLLAAGLFVALQRGVSI